MIIGGGQTRAHVCKYRTAESVSQCCNLCIYNILTCDLSIATCFLGGGGVVVANILALYAFDRSYTPPSQDKAGFTYVISCTKSKAQLRELGIDAFE